MNWKRTLASPAHITPGKNCLTSIKCESTITSHLDTGDKELSWHLTNKSWTCSHEVKVTEVTAIKAFVNLPVKQLMSVTGINTEEQS